jgi:hypothetical protein
VLARLPEVATVVSQALQPPGNPPVTGAVDYRFDPPQPQSFRRISRGDRGPRAAAGESPILPSSNPFAIPGPGLMTALGPVLRFVMLAALFTAAGIIILTSGKENRTSREVAPAKAAAGRHALEPAAAAMEPSLPATSAAGPNAAPHPSVGHQRAALPNAPDLSPPAGQGPLDDSPAWGDPSDNTSHATDAYPHAGGLWVPRARGNGQLVPRVQTSDPPPAVAHLPGYITEIPPRHASHDENQSSLY